MTLIFADSFEHYPDADLRKQHGESARLNKLWPPPKYPGVYTIEALPDGRAEVIRTYEDQTESRTLAAGEEIWGIQWNGVTYSVDMPTAEVESGEQ